jgi:hypothetical protein
MSQTIRWFTLGIALLALITMVSAQYPSSNSISNPTYGLVQGNNSQYSQYYQMLSGPAPSNLISAPEPYDIAGHSPNMVFLTTQNQAVLYSRYQANTNYTGNTLWIQGTTDWAQYAIVPQGATVSLIAISPVEGIGNLIFKDYDGQIYGNNFYFYPDNHLTFYADKAGRHILSFVSGNKSSNAVVIDVTGAYTPPSNYLPAPIAYFSGFNNPYYNPQASLALADITKANQNLYGNDYSSWYFGANAWLNAPYR